MSNAAKLTAEYTRRAVIVFESVHLDWACCDEFRYAIEHGTIAVSEEHEYLSLEEEWDREANLHIEAPGYSEANRVRQGIRLCPFCGERIIIKVKLEEDL
jgi:hypothetical protein